MVLAGEALGGYRAEGHAAPVAAIGCIVLVAIRDNGATLVENDAGTVQLVAQGVENFSIYHPLFLLYLDGTPHR